MNDLEIVDLNAYVVRPEEKSENPPSDVGKIKKTKKVKKKPYQSDIEDLRKKAKSMCKTFEQYKIVKRYKRERLADWIQQKEFDQDSALRENVFSMIHKGYAVFLDLVSGGGGHVREQISNDLTLRESIETEGHDFVKFLNNKLKIVALSASDVMHGKLEQKKHTPPEPIEMTEPEYFEPPIINESQGHYEDPTDISEQQTETDEILLQMPEDSEDVQGDSEIPGDIISE